MRKALTLAVLLIITLPLAAGSVLQAFTPHYPRNLSMGGAAVASSCYEEVIFSNPALVGSDNSYLALPSFSFTLYNFNQLVQPGGVLDIFLTKGGDEAVNRALNQLINSIGAGESDVVSAQLSLGFISGFTGLSVDSGLRVHSTGAGGESSTLILDADFAISLAFALPVEINEHHSLSFGISAHLIFRGLTLADMYSSTPGGFTAGSIYDFYKQRKMNVRLARVFPISADDAMQSPMYVSDEEFAAALIEYFDLWASDPQPAYNTDIVKLVADLLLGSPSICLREAECHKRYLALSPGGDIFSCAEFDTPDTVIGNFLTQSPQEFAQSDARERLAARAPVPAQCRQCRYLPTCNGSCLRERYVLGYPYRCLSNRLYWDHVVAWLEDRGCSLYMLRGKSPAEKREIIDRIFKKQ